MNIEELKRLADAATPGPWEYQKDGKDFPVNGYVTVRDCIYSVCVLPYEGIRADDRVTDNGRFIAAANPAAILELIAQLRNAREERNKLLAALKDARELVDDWGAYATAYMQEKHGLAEDLERLDAAISKVEEQS